MLFCFYGLDMQLEPEPELFKSRNRNRNFFKSRSRNRSHNFSKVGTGTGTSKKIITVPQRWYFVIFYFYVTKIKKGTRWPQNKKPGRVSLWKRTVKKMCLEQPIWNFFLHTIFVVDSWHLCTLAWSLLSSGKFSLTMISISVVDPDPLGSTSN